MKAGDKLNQRLAHYRAAGGLRPNRNYSDLAREARSIDNLLILDENRNCPDAPPPSPAHNDNPAPAAIPCNFEQALAEPIRFSSQLNAINFASRVNVTSYATTANAAATAQPIARKESSRSLASRVNAESCSSESFRERVDRDRERRTPISTRG